MEERLKTSRREYRTEKMAVTSMANVFIDITVVHTIQQGNIHFHKNFNLLLVCVFVVVVSVTNNIINSNTARLYRQWRKPVIYSATNHWAEARDAIWCHSNAILTLCWRQSSFSMCKNRNRSALVRDLLCNKSQFVGHSCKKIQCKSLAIRSRDLIYFTTDLQTVIYYSTNRC